MGRIGLIALCLLVAGVAGGTTSASAGQHPQRHKSCHKQHKRHKQHRRSKRCRRNKQHRVNRSCRKLRKQQRPRAKRCRRWQQGVERSAGLKRGAGQTSGGPSTSAVPPTLSELIAPETVCPGQSDEGLSLASQEATMGCMINFARSRAGEQGLAPVAALDESSDDKANDIVQCDDFSHTACGRAFTYWLEQHGFLQLESCRPAGENIAWGTGELGTVRSILTAWVHSPDHWANMLSASFDQFGVGVQVGPLSGYPDAHVWVTHFGGTC